jgi:hypothetical protein
VAFLIKASSFLLICSAPANQIKFHRLPPKISSERTTAARPASAQSRRLSAKKDELARPGTNRHDPPNPA